MATTRYSGIGLELVALGIVLVLASVYIWQGLTGPKLIDTSRLPSTAQVNNQATTQALSVKLSAKNCEDGSLQTSTLSIPQTSSQSNASTTQGTSGPTQASASTSQLQSRTNCNASSQAAPLQPAGSKATFEQFDSQR